MMMKNPEISAFKNLSSMLLKQVAHTVGGSVVSKLKLAILHVQC